MKNVRQEFLSMNQCMPGLVEEGVRGGARQASGSPGPNILPQAGLGAKLELPYVLSSIIGSDDNLDASNCVCVLFHV